ncbi:MAG: UDP-N-acetylmuramate:L-alanyl-gamma-D-glutamyl-meso-diaminopimelate ligase [Burkholderiaceae bacterium]|nr:UDP-N-acetylmuramate:L-alanyl-gamma-D-glutamyl-meso-diaminopimelate ligase [Burkholderiaceae bacterium]
MHIHIVGICGTFMGGVALLARAAGHRVTGCDADIYPPMSEQLAAAGIEIIEGFDASQLALRPDLFVIGNVVRRGNELVEAILEAGVRYVSGPQWVGEHVLTGRHVLAVAGTHGKTTTASMLAWILECAGHAPGFLIGGVPRNFGVSARAGGPLFVIEADEYDTAFFDKRAKFVHYRPRTVVLNNLEFDHADIYPDLAAIETQFHHLLRTVPRSGRLIVNGRDAALARVLARGLWSEVERFDVADGWHALDVEEGAQHRFTVARGAEQYGRLTLPLAGAFNRSNALAAIAAAQHVGVPPGLARQALAHFAGVKRRLEPPGSGPGGTVHDDFAHHPTAIAATLAALRRRIAPHERILAVLEPRSNTMKLGVLAAQLPDALAEADQVFCYCARSGRQALAWDPAQVLAPLGARARSFEDLPALVQAVVAAARAGDHVLVMSNGSFGGIHERLLAALGRQPAHAGMA